MIPYKDVYKDIAAKEDIIAGAVAAARVAAGGGGIPTVEQLKAAAYANVTELAVGKLTRSVDYFLENAVAEFEMIEGSRPNETNWMAPDAPAGLPPTLHEVAQTWRDKFDAFLIDKFGKDTERAIGPSAIGEHFTDADVDDPEVRAAVSAEIAQRLAEAAQPMDNANTTEAKRSVNKTLSAVGIVSEDFAQYVVAPAGNNPAAAVDIDESVARAQVEMIVGAYAIREGVDKFDPLVLAEILESAFDEDHFIACGGIERLGGSVASVPFFKAYKLALPLEAAGNTMLAAHAALTHGTVLEAVKPPKVKKVKITKGDVPALPSAAVTSSPAAPQAPPPNGSNGAAGTDYGDIVRLWTQYATDGATDIAKEIGVSRGTVSNINAGKAKLPLTVEQRQAIRALLTNKLKGLQEALTKLDAA